MLVNIGMLFTYDYSLKTWLDSGTLSKEVNYYKKIAIKNNINFTFFTYGDNSDKHLLNFDFIHVIPIYSKINRSKYKFINYIKSFLIPFYFWDEFKKIDLLKQNQLQGAWVAILIKILLRKPFYLRTGYDVYLFSVKNNKNIIIRSIYFLLTQLGLLASDFYSVASKTEKSFINKRYILSNKVGYLPNCVDLVKINSKKRYSDRVIAAGRLEAQKNYFGLIDALTDSTITLDIIGSGSLKNKIENYAILKNVQVKFLGKLENEDLQLALQKYDYYVNFSLFEGNPKTVLEAMANGCIVFCSNIDNHLEIICDNVNGFITKDKDSLIARINDINSNVVSKSKLRKASMKTIEENFEIEKIADYEYEIYKQLIY